MTTSANNICERALKRAVLQGKNALFYRTLHGAEVGDLLMTLIHTCQLCGAKGFIIRRGKSRRYEPAVEGLRAITALLVVREKVIRPFIAASGNVIPRPKLKNQTRVD